MKAEGGDRISLQAYPWVTLSDCRTENLVRSDTEKNRGNFIECDVTMEPREEGKITM